MKLFLILLAGILPVVVLGQSNKMFTIKGTFKDHENAIIYLRKYAGENPPQLVDSCNIDKDGNFTLKALNSGESLFSLLPSRGPMAKELIRIINDTESIHIRLNASNPEKNEITGSPASKELQIYLSKLTKYYTQLNTLSTQEKDPEKFKTKRKDIFSKINELFTTEINNVSNGTLAAEILTLNPELSSEDGLAKGNELLKKFPSSEILKAYITSLENLNKKQRESKQFKNDIKGKKAPDFSALNMQDKKVAIKSATGKYILIDFWASWCLPCRIENKNVKELYKQYKDKGFNVVGVSFDDDKNKWIKALEKDQLPWTQLYDAKAFSSEAAILYKLFALPSNVLIDNTGTVIAVNIFREELKNKLSELMK
ncbi:TlpA family protein disulfide reductase [Chryseobacterium sp. CBSDS_008]|uniref:TlpA family protein disulfide reductase n=1 Tax=Chryseobacterium sp. CBSDS_008 TaxID=3415265 RepID=UPI003CEFF76F